MFPIFEIRPEFCDKLELDLTQLRELGMAKRLGTSRTLGLDAQPCKPLGWGLLSMPQNGKIAESWQQGGFPEHTTAIQC